MRYTRRDPALRSLMLADLISQCVEDKQSVVLPEGVMVQYVSQARFKDY